MPDSPIQVWLARQCQLIRGVERGVVVLAGGDGSAAARWPERAGSFGELTELANAAQLDERVHSRSQPPSDDAPLGLSQIALPFTAGALSGAVAVEIGDAKDSELGSVVDLLRLGTHWLTVLARRPLPKARGMLALEIATRALEEPSFQAAVTTVTTALATHLCCERVSVGLRRGDAIRIHGVSHSARFDIRSNAVQKIAVAMEEAIDQDAVVAYPPVGEGPVRITREHGSLASDHPGGAALTVPMASGDRIVGALLFERAGAEFDPPTRQRCEDAAALLGPILVLRQAAELSAFGRARKQLAAWISQLRGSDHPRARLVTASIGLVLVLLGFVESDHRVTADATIEGRVQRAIVAGLDGYIAEANARAGDVVKRGQPLGRLDDRDLQLERRKWAGHRDQLRKEYREALASLDRAQVNIVSARIAQADAQLGLLEAKLERTRLVASFDGVVVRGDLSQSLGSPVARGDVLFELAPLEGYRVILRVDERDIASIAPGRPGQLALSAMPGDRLAFTVDRVTPVATSADGRNTFRVEAQLDEPTAALRPGLEGVAKIEAGRARVIWIWTHDLIDWIRLWAWSWWP